MCTKGSSSRQFGTTLIQATSAAKKAQRQTRGRKCARRKCLNSEFNLELDAQAHNFCNTSKPNGIIPPALDTPVHDRGNTPSTDSRIKGIDATRIGQQAQHEPQRARQAPSNRHYSNETMLNLHPGSSIRHVHVIVEASRAAAHSRPQTAPGEGRIPALSSKTMASFVSSEGPQEPCFASIH